MSIGCLLDTAIATVRICEIYLGRRKHGVLQNFVIEEIRKTTCFVLLRSTSSTTVERTHLNRNKNESCCGARQTNRPASKSNARSWESFDGAEKQAGRGSDRIEGAPCRECVLASPFPTVDDFARDDD
jgi:hypothetical protein